jgi:predicted membrane protein
VVHDSKQNVDALVFVVAVVGTVLAMKKPMALFCEETGRVEVWHESFQISHTCCKARNGTNLMQSKSRNKVRGTNNFSRAEV